MNGKRGRTLTYPGLKEYVYIPQFQPDPSICKYSESHRVKLL